MGRWHFFSSLTCIATLISLTLVMGCGSSLSYLSRPGNPEQYEHYRNATVALVELTSGGNMVGPNCSGFFISPRRLVTAEHCVVDQGQVLEFAPGVGRRIIPVTPEPTIGREILFVSYEDEEDFFSREHRPSRGPNYHRSKVIAVDTENDVAILELIDGEEDWVSWFEMRNLEQEPVLVGERVFAISDPVGQTFMLGEGIISRVRVIENKVRIFHQVRVGPGSSGSVLLDRQARVIGVNVAISRNNILTITIPATYIQAQLNTLETQRESQTVDENAGLSEDLHE